MCVFFTSEQSSHAITASVIFTRCPMWASAAMTLSGATPLFRVMHMVQRAAPRMASVTASVSLPVTGSFRGGYLRPSVWPRHERRRGSRAVMRRTEVRAKCQGGPTPAASTEDRSGRRGESSTTRESQPEMWTP